MLARIPSLLKQIVNVVLSAGPSVFVLAGRAVAVLRRAPPPAGARALRPGICEWVVLPDKQDFADVITLTDLKGGLSWVIPGGPV